MHYRTHSPEKVRPRPPPCLLLYSNLLLIHTSPLLPLLLLLLLLLQLLQPQLPLLQLGI
jgi:hypothetical protein